jgi:hypothetical protein
LKAIAPLKEGGFYKTYNEGVCFVFDHIGSFFVSYKAEVSFQLESDNLSAEVVSGYLDGSILAAQLTFKGFLVLHGGLVEMEGKLIGLIGDSGIGKSTLLQGLHKSFGYNVFADDLIALEVSGDTVKLNPTEFTGLRLWGNSLEAFSMKADELEKVHPLHSKVKVPFKIQQPNKRTLDALIVLDYGAHLSLDRLNQTESFRHVLGHLKCKDYMPSTLEASHFNMASKAANQIPMYVLKRAKGFENLQATLQLLANANF